MSASDARVKDLVLTMGQGNVIRVAWSSFESVFQQSMNKIREYRELIELEAFAANVEGSIRRHQELKSILAQKTSNQRVSIRLPCHCILFQQNPRFSGRDAALDHLTSSLISDKSAVQRSLAVVGLGGVGKTQLATQFAWQHVVDFEVILWAQADSLQKLEQSYVHFARKLGLLDGLDTSDVSHVVESVVAWFEETGKLAGVLVSLVCS